MSILTAYNLSKNITAKLCATILLLGFISSAHAATKANTSSFNTSARGVSTLSLQNLLRPDLTIEQRSLQLSKRQRQLTDMERMVMRDERLAQSGSAHVKRAFDDFDRTFLVHAGAENKRNAGEQWLATINMSNHAIMNARMGFRK
jgi:hypothetical protein